MVVAVKKIESPGETRMEAELDKQFESEATVLGGIRHRNIVKLLGYISGVDTKLLLYEYIER
uniref:non-specific serine/threonine protein kinase n=1 Tax=Aegilops tauschii subsp. strangulata TaxID=200361 RepID=A0A453EID8_AEGTS